MSNLNSMLRTALTAMLFNLTSPAMAVDLEALWDFSNPALSEQRFQAALASADPDDSSIPTLVEAWSTGANRCMNSSGINTRRVVPSRQALVVLRTT